MICPECKSLNTYVTEVRQVGGANYRRHTCKECDAMFFTKEDIVDPAEGRAKLSEWHKERRRIQ